MYEQMPQNFPEPQPPIPVELPHAGMGVASFIISIPVGILLFAVFVIAGVMEASTPGGIDEDAPILALIGLFMLGLLGLEVVAFGLGIGGLCQPRRRKLFAILGMVFAAMGLLSTAALMIIGSLAA